MFIFKAKEYQSEKSPIFDSQKSTKTTRKLHIMSQLYAAKVCQLFSNTRYITHSYIILTDWWVDVWCDAPGLLLFVQFTDCPVTPRSTSTIPAVCHLFRLRGLARVNCAFWKEMFLQLFTFSPFFVVKSWRVYPGLNPCEVRCWTVRQMAGAQILKIKHNLKIFPVAGKYLWW